MRVLGIDPGLRLTGYAVVDAAAALSGGRREPRLVEAGVIRLDAQQSVERRLGELWDDLSRVVDEHRPDVLAVEKLFAHYNHPRTAIIMAHGRGIVLLLAQQRGLRVAHLAATEVKKAVTGHGHASKGQVQRAIAVHFGLDEPPSPPDVADAMAIALCHAWRVGVG